MRINGITGVNNISFKKNSNVNPAMTTERKIVLGAQCIGAIGLAGAVIVLKENNINLYKMAKNSIHRFFKSLEAKTPDNKLLELLDGKRDSEGVKIYNNYLAEKKKKSLAQRFLRGELQDKSPRAFHQIAENSIEFQRITGEI